MRAWQASAVRIEIFNTPAPTSYPQPHFVNLNCRSDECTIPRRLQPRGLLPPGDRVRDPTLKRQKRVGTRSAPGGRASRAPEERYAPAARCAGRALTALSRRIASGWCRAGHHVACTAAPGAVLDREGEIARNRIRSHPGRASKFRGVPCCRGPHWPGLVQGLQGPRKHATRRRFSPSSASNPSPRLRVASSAVPRAAGTSPRSSARAASPARGRSPRAASSPAVDTPASH